MYGELTGLWGGRPQAAATDGWLSNLMGVVFIRTEAASFAQEISMSDALLVSDQVDLRHDAGPLDVLDFMWLEVTNRCNLQCSHCYAGSSPHEPESYGLELPDWLQLLSDARALGCRQVQFIGGEPLLYSGLPALLRHARLLDYETIEVFTNATRLSDDMARLFQENGVLLATSFYSEDDCTHDTITGVRGSQTRTLRGLERAIAARIPVRVGIIEMPNTRDKLKVLLNFCNV